MSKAATALFLASIPLILPAGATAGPIGGVGPDPLPTKPEKAILKKGFAIAPENAPRDIKRAIKAANQIAKKPYRWGGGHTPWSGRAKQYIKKARGFDCSGSVSFVLGDFGGRWLDSPLTSSGFLSWGKKGRGRWLTVHTGPGHAYLVIAGLRFDTSGLEERGTRWSRERQGMSGLGARTLR